MPALAEHQRYGIEGIFRKELGAAENDSDEPHGVEERGDKVGQSTGAQFSASDRGGEPREPHGHAAGEARNGETARRASQLLARVLLNLREDLDRGGAFEVLLNLRCSRRPLRGRGFFR